MFKLWKLKRSRDKLQRAYDKERAALIAKKIFRRLIDEEKTRRFEVKTLWVTKLILPVLGGLVGLIGAATGFIAVWRHGK